MGVGRISKPCVCKNAIQGDYLERLGVDIVGKESQGED